MDPKKRGVSNCFVQPGINRLVNKLTAAFIVQESSLHHLVGGPNLVDKIVISLKSVVQAEASRQGK